MKDTASLPHIISAFWDLHNLNGVPLAVAVSGGPDSMALAHALVAQAAESSAELHILTVDHGLRAEAAKEAADVAAYFGGKDHVTTQVLKRILDEDNKHKRIQETARKDRYALMADYCAEKGMKYLFLAHHADDQMETVLFRLAKGSGLDGLAGMRDVQPYGKGLTLCRPLLSLSKEDLLSYCAAYDIPYIEDKSNEDDKFARVRLRKSQDVLAEEGFTAQRLSVTAQRISRAGQALDFFVEKVLGQALKNKETDRFVFSLSELIDAPEEIRLRIFQRVFGALSLETQPYGPRLEKIEVLVTDLFAAPQDFKRRSLGGCFISCSCDEDGALLLVIEKDASCGA